MAINQNVNFHTDSSGVLPVVEGLPKLIASILILHLGTFYVENEKEMSYVLMPISSELSTALSPLYCRFKRQSRINQSACLMPAFYLFTTCSPTCLSPVKSIPLGDAWKIISPGLPLFRSPHHLPLCLFPLQSQSF